MRRACAGPVLVCDPWECYICNVNSCRIDRAQLPNEECELACWYGPSGRVSRMKRDVLTVVVGSTLTIFLDLIVRAVIHMFLGVLSDCCVRYFVSSSITGLCLASGAGLMERVGEM
jgi:hypothetical protein